MAFFRFVFFWCSGPGDGAFGLVWLDAWEWAIVCVFLLGSVLVSALGCVRLGSVLCVCRVGWVLDAVRMFGWVGGLAVSGQVDVRCGSDVWAGRWFS